MQKEALLPPPLKKATGNLVNFEKTSEMSPIKDEFGSSCSNKKFNDFGRKLKKKSI